MAEATNCAKQVGLGLLIAIAMTGCLRHEMPITTGSLKDDTPSAHNSKPSAPAAKPAPAKKPVKKSAAAIEKAQAPKKAEAPKAPSPVATKDNRVAASGRDKMDQGKIAAAPEPRPSVVAPAPRQSEATQPARSSVATLPPAAEKSTPAIAAPAAPIASAPPAATIAAATPPAKAAPTTMADSAQAPAVRKIADGRKLFDAGKVAEARQAYSALLTAAPGEANHALAQSFDPHYVNALKNSNAPADVGRALLLYTTAVQSGAKDAAPDLARIRQSLGLPPK